MRPTARSSPRIWSAAACLLVASLSGCTSALTTAYLRDGLWGDADHAQVAADGADEVPDRGATEPPAEPAADGVVDVERREAALHEAMDRLSRLGAIDPAVEAALVATLQRTQPEDWPVVIEEFTASLPKAAAEPAADSPPAEVGDGADRTAAEPEPVAVASPAPADAEPAPPAAGEASAPDVPPPAVVPAPEVVASSASPLSVRRACFATAVRAWGDVDAFPADRFQPGQEVIVYVELDNVAAGESPAGHTTCIDSTLRLVAADGGLLHDWRVEPIAETCATPRRDYFARWVLRIPESVPMGDCRVEVAVTDTIGGSSAATTLPLEIAVAD